MSRRVLRLVVERREGWLKLVNEGGIMLVLKRELTELITRIDYVFLPMIAISLVAKTTTLS